MILTKQKILEEIENGNIVIEPFNPSNVNPNSYNLTLGDRLVEMSGPLDVKQRPVGIDVEIPEEGYVLQPGKIYLAATVEYTETHNYVPVLFGRSSLSRLGLAIHCTGGFGDVGFKGNWTITLCPALPIRIYKDIKICQIVYFSVLGETEEYSSEKYQAKRGIQESKLFTELSGDKNK